LQKLIKGVIIGENLYCINSDNKSYDLRASSESRCLVRIGDSSKSFHFWSCWRWVKGRCPLQHHRVVGQLPTIWVATRNPFVPYYWD